MDILLFFVIYKKQLGEKTKIDFPNKLLFNDSLRQYRKSYNSMKSD